MIVNRNPVGQQVGLEISGMDSITESRVLDRLRDLESFAGVTQGTIALPPLSVVVLHYA
jgi:hypothetical protein